jgi:hypothetical protein
MDDIGFGGYNLTEATLDVTSMLAHYSASHWNDPYVETQFYLKAYDFTPQGNMTAGEEYVNGQVSLVGWLWSSVTSNEELSMSANLESCMDQIMENWTWENMQAILTSDDYNWGLTHGDFHAG